MDIAVVVLYLIGMLAVGVWGRMRAKNQEEYLVAGRRLGPLLFTGTMAAVVLGGASTVGGIGLGYMNGISGMWLVFFIGFGIIALSLLFAPRIQRLEIYTVSQMLELRYGKGSRMVSGIIMTGYGLMISTTSTVAYGTIFHALFGIDKVPAILLGGSIVIIYSMLGGMWSITLTDFVQFIIQTIGIFLILLPIVLTKAGGLGTLKTELPDEMFNPLATGWDTILMYFLVYGLGLLIGQDIWQRVFTARTPGVARWGGVSAGVYCLFYAVAGALVGVAAQKIVPGIAERDDVFPAVVDATMSPLIAGFVLAAALSAVMSTSSGALLAASTVFRQDVIEPVFESRRIAKSGSDGGLGGQLAGALVRETGDEVRDSRVYLVLLGIVTLLLAIAMPDVVMALTVAYNLLVGGLFVPIVGGLIWKRGTIVGVLAAMVAGAATAIGIMAFVDVFANSAIYLALTASAVAYVIGSLASKPTDPAVMTAWRERLAR